MKVTNEFLIPFIGLKLGKHHFEFQINKKFFENFDYHEFEDCDIKIAIVLEKKSTLLELDFKQNKNLARSWNGLRNCRQRASRF